MPLDAAYSSRPPWVPELSVHPDEELSEADRLSRAIELSEEDGLDYLAQLRSSVGIFRSLDNDRRGFSAVHIAVLCQRYQTLRALLHSGLVDINQASSNAAKKGWTALHFAAFQLDLDALHILLDHNCNVALRTKLGSTPLHFVTGRFGNRGPHLNSYVRSIILSLVRAGVDPGATNNYGYTVLHEAIMWSDVTSLGVLLEQSNSNYFGKLPLIGHVLPHELVGRSAVLPRVFKKTLYATYYSLRRKKESTGVRIPRMDMELQLLENLHWVSNPSPPTVERINFPHPECLAPDDVGSLLSCEPQNVVVELLKYKKSIVEYEEFTSKKTRYAFPAYYQYSPDDWVCTDCRDCTVVAGRWFKCKTATAAKEFLGHLMILLLSRFSFSRSSALASNVCYFSSDDGVQLALKYADFVRSHGVIIQVCSSSSSSSSSSAVTTSEAQQSSRKLLDAVIEMVYQDCKGVGPHAVVSSRDLREGKNIPHLFTLSEIRRAKDSKMNFLSNPASMLNADTFADLLLESSTKQESVECDSSVHNAVTLPPKPLYKPSGEDWSQDIHCKVMKHHREDVIKLINADVMIDYLVKKEAIPQRDADYITSTRNSEDKVLRLLEVVETGNIHYHCFTILRETGDELPPHGKLYDILNETCSTIHASGSLNNFYLDREDTLPSHHVPTDTEDIPDAYERDSVSCATVPSCGRATADSGYLTDPSLLFSTLSSRYSIATPFSSRSTVSRSLPSQISHESHAEAATNPAIRVVPPGTNSSTEIKQEYYVSSVYRCHKTLSVKPSVRRHSLTPHTSSIEGSSTNTSTSITSLCSSCVKDSTCPSAPITIPRRRSSSSSSPTDTPPSSNTVRQNSATKMVRSSPTHKHLSCDSPSKPASMWEKIFRTVFTSGKDNKTSLGIKLQ